MGQFDIEVKQQLGREAFDYIVNRVKCGVIDAQHMKDISQQLHKHVAGRHLQRLETGNKSDEAEFRNILFHRYRAISYHIISIHFFCGTGIALSDPTAAQMVQQGLSGLIKRI